MSQYVLSDDKILKHLVSNNQIMEVFPFLKEVQTAAPPPGCASCQRAKYMPGFQRAVNRAKHMLASLDPEQVVTLKRLLNLPPGTEIRIWYLDPYGKKGTQKAQI